jgi:hypothetical protein
MKKTISSIAFLACAATLPVIALAQTGGEPRVLPGEQTAEQILNGEYRFPPSPVVPVSFDDTGFANERLTKTPAPGVHPRILLGPEDLPDLRKRLAETQSGKAMLETLRSRVNASILKPNTWENDLYNKLAAGETETALAILNKNSKPSSPVGHYQPYILYALVMEAFDSMLTADAVRGKRVAAAVASYAKIAEPLVEKTFSQPMSDDVWRVKIQGSATGNWTDSQGLRELIGYHLLGYAYDFSYNFMTHAQRAQTRRTISKVTNGKIWLGASLPHHWRNWNWNMVAMGQPLLALAIEGEEGYDPRVYKLAVNIVKDYLTYGISEKGSSTEAVGYTQFGFVWAAPFIVAAARRGDNLLTQNHYRAMNNWYLHTMEPYAPTWANKGPEGDAEQQQRSLPPIWTSHGDGGDEGPSIWSMMMWKYFYPNDPKIDYIWRVATGSIKGKPFSGTYHIIEPLLWASDAISQDGKPVDYAYGAKLNEPLTFFDPARSSLVTRDKWSGDASVLQFECRTDSVGSSHEHADRANFTFSALGRQWAKESFRSIETRHHNNILIDGVGQGYWGGPGNWNGMQENEWGLIAAADAKPAYDVWMPKQIITDSPDPNLSPRFKYERWAAYKAQAEDFRKTFDVSQMHRDQRPSIVRHFSGFEQGDQRMWDEDGWPNVLPFNPVERAFRTIAFMREENPYVLIVDDIQKDYKERLYEWLMMTGINTEIADLKENDIFLSDANVARDENGLVKLKKGDRELLVRVLDLSDPAKLTDYQSRPSVRLDTFEKKDTDISNRRTYGVDKRLVIPSRSVAPNYKILLFPHRKGDALPITTWNSDHTAITVEIKGRKDVISFTKNRDGRTRVAVERSGKGTLALK